MAIDPYASCPCGSGKKFKWCCIEIHEEIEKAFEQMRSGQQDAALQSMEDVVRRHAGNPEALGRLAQLQAAMGQAEEAEKTLEKAFAINPNYAFGYLLRGTFRQQEGEMLGALLLFRQAADKYAPDAVDMLASIYEMIADIEMRLNRPLAAGAALRKAVHLAPANAELRQALDATFGPRSPFPECAKKEYAFRAAVPASAQWNQVLDQAGTGKFADARDVFQKWVDQHPDDPAGWFNLGLVRAWMGDSPQAVEALSKSVELDPDEARATEAWALAEVLRCSHGLEAESDYIENRVFLEIRDPRALVGLLQNWEQNRRIIGLRSDPERGVLTALVLAEVTSLVLSGPSAPLAPLASYLMIVGNLLQIWHPRAETLDMVLEEIKSRLGAAVNELQRLIQPVNFGDVSVEAMLFPTGQQTELEVKTKIREHAQNFFEEKWIHQPLKSLLGVPPIDAVGTANLRKRVRGVIQFLSDCTLGSNPELYDFDRLRQKLGLGQTGTAVSSPDGTTASAGEIDVSALGAAELAALDANTMTETQLDRAFRAALSLDAQDLAGKFAEKLVAMPVAPERADRWAIYHNLIQRAQQAGNAEEALRWIDQGRQSDQEANEGRRAVDYDLRKARILAKSNAGEAKALFERLLAAAADPMKIAGPAAETMLATRDAASARHFAEQGLAAARAQNNRDSEGYFQELLEAASRAGR